MFPTPRDSDADRPICPGSISLLTDFEDAASYLDWTIGVHGIHISFPHPTSTSSETPSPLSSSAYVPTLNSFKRTYTATYLPQIAPEQGWDKLETIDSAIRKAGWNGRIMDDIRRSIKLRRYQSRKCTVGWEEYVQWRKDNGGEM
jgi:AMME syndrome candidate gene 1 protein